MDADTRVAPSRADISLACGNWGRKKRQASEEKVHSQVSAVFEKTHLPVQQFQIVVSLTLSFEEFEGLKGCWRKDKMERKASFFTCSDAFFVF